MNCVRAGGLIFCLQDSSYKLPIMSFVRFGLESALLHGFCNKALLELCPLSLQLHLKSKQLVDGDVTVALSILVRQCKSLLNVNSPC